MPTRSCDGVNAEPGMWPASYSERSRTSRIWTSSACLGSSSSGIRSTRSIGRFSCRQLVTSPSRYCRWRRARSSRGAAAGALLVDVRTDQQFDDAHIPGAVCNPMLTAGFGSKLAWIGDPELELVFVGRDDEDGRRAARLALSVGLRRLGGYLHGGMTSWRQEKPPDRARRADAARGAAQARGLVQILDVRERSEYDAGHIPGSAFTPWHDIEGLPDGLDPRAVAVVCASGQRAATAASLVLRARRARGDPRGRGRRAQVGPPRQPDRDA